MCELCKKEENAVLVLLPIKRAGALQTQACLDCARKSGVFCTTHDSPHQGFEDGTTACLTCIEERLAKADSRWQARLWAQQVQEGLSESENMALSRAAIQASRASGSTIEVAILRFIVTKALRKGMTEIDVIKEVNRHKKAAVLL